VTIRTEDLMTFLYNKPVATGGIRGYCSPNFLYDKNKDLASLKMYFASPNLNLATGLLYNGKFCSGIADSFTKNFQNFKISLKSYRKRMLAQIPTLYSKLHNLRRDKPPKLRRGGGLCICVQDP